MIRPISLCAVLLAAPLARLAPPAGPLVVTGIVQPVPGPTICMQGGTHFLECTQVFLKSSVVNLTALVGQNVRLTGSDVGITCHVIQVASAQPADPTLEWCGTPAPGCSVKLKVCPGAIGLALLLLSTGPSFVPVSLPLNPTPEVVLVAPPLIPIPVAFGGTGCFDNTIPIPPDPALVGASFWLQGGRMDIGPAGPFQLTNAVCLTILPPLPPCIVPGC
ncbi:MAG TPA: hypothetical protein VFI25_16815 [Planctomycetota bacterium]|jgi:hypothetical protein|nr:hypothetical protein [Planctomycetota bacterium]